MTIQSEIDKDPDPSQKITINSPRADPDHDTDEDGGKATTQHLSPNDNIVEADAMVEQTDHEHEVRQRLRDRYQVGQVFWTFINNPDADLSPNGVGGNRDITLGGLRLAGWRPVIVLDIFSEFCSVAEICHPGRQYFDGLSLRELVERGYVVMDASESFDYASLSEDHHLFRSIGEPFRVNYHNDEGKQRLLGWSLVQPLRVHSPDFEHMGTLCGHLTEESTARLLAVRKSSCRLSETVESVYDLDFTRAPIPNQLTPEYRTAILWIKNEIRRPVPPPGSPATANDARLDISELFDFSSTIPNRGHAVSPSLIMKKARDASYECLKSAEITKVQTESLLYQAEEEYDDIQANWWASTAERNSLRRKRNDAEAEWEVALLQEKGYGELFIELINLLPDQSQFQGQGEDVQLCSTLSRKFTKVQIDVWNARAFLDQRRRTQLSQQRSCFGCIADVS
ncbi:hypothetical protein J4E93_005440 [Alternaria ventricosa]|uniref:uncharacterized protein n=1 Tax=Alternaria ventricosa TaxID=1187951 RepID=UPI0020C4E7D0|nr:uncharacterized protein J4E93_005440 [Alternaria ventricosa]KAI4645862.1 hypothetical protein J4E93_005440 [Alternaria ventricosa]